MLETLIRQTLSQSHMNEVEMGIPMLTFSRFEDALAQITAQAKPLVLYCFTEDEINQEKVLSQVSFGGVGDSGMGSYHGDRSFYELSHEKAVVVRKIA